MRDSDRGEGRAKCTPGCANFRLAKPCCAAANHSRRKAVKHERDVASSIAIQAACYIPERSAEQHTKYQIRGIGQPVRQAWIYRRDPQWRGRDQIPQGRMTSIE